MAFQGDGYITSAGRDAMAEALNSGQDIEIGSYGLSSQDIDISVDTTTDDLVNFLTEDITVGSKSALDGTVYIELKKTSDELTDDTRVISIFLTDGSLFIVLKPTYFMPQDRGFDFGLGIGMGSSNTELTLINVTDGAKANLFGDCDINFSVKTPSLDCHAVDWGTAKKLGGLKNLWVDGAMNIWADGTSGDMSADNQPRYGYGLQIMRYHSHTDDDGAVTGTHGSVYRWEKVEENDKNWLKITHAGATQSGYIGQRWERTTLQYLKGKTVTLSFLYKCGTDMKGRIYFYNEQDIMHDGVGTNMALETVQYIGDNQVHRIEITVTLGTDNVIPNESAYFGIQLGYGGNVNGEDAIPNGSIQFTEIQLEVNDKATDFGYVSEAVEKTRYARYYHVVNHTIFLDGYTLAGMYTQAIYGLPVEMKSVPTIIPFDDAGLDTQHIQDWSITSNDASFVVVGFRSNTDNARAYKTFPAFRVDARIY